VIKVSGPSTQAVGAHALAVFHKVIFRAHLGASYPRLSWLVEKKVVQKSYNPHAARGYC